MTVTNHWIRRRNSLMFLYQMGFQQLECDFFKEDEDSKMRDEELKHDHFNLYTLFVIDDLCREILKYV